MIKNNEDYIRSLISLKEEYWENDFDTNCYAFALGLDIPESEIGKNAYQLGFIASQKFGLSFQDILKLSFEDRFTLDLKALKIAYFEITKDEKAGWYYLGNYVCTYWDVILYVKNNDFHFAKRTYDGELYHKIGYLGKPQKCIDNKEYLQQFKLVKKYRLRYWEKI